MLREGGCNLRLVKFLIMDNKLSLYGDFLDHNRTLNLTHLLKKVLDRVKIPDMFFVVHIEDELSEINIPYQSRKRCR